MRDVEWGKSDFGLAALDCLDALYGYALALCRNPASAEDLVQEAYLRASRGRRQLAPDSNIKSWLFTILRNAWLNELRHARSGPEFLALEPEDEDFYAAPEGADPYTLFVRKIEREQVRSAISRLPRHQREVIVLRDLEGFSYQEIAEILDCPAGTVMSRLGRARRHLRVLLGETILKNGV